MVLKAGIWALRLGFEMVGGGRMDGQTEKKEKEKEKEKIPHMCESIGHRPLRGRCPKGESETDRQTDRQTNRDRQTEKELAEKARE